jgi:predicted GNAT family N-acyltransferase
MLRIENISLNDLSFAVNLTNTMNWDLVVEDFEFMMELEPMGCFIALDDTKKMGIATTISYENWGWLGNVIVSEKYRGRGVGSHLVRHALEFLVNKDIETVGLYAYLHKVPFYKKLGFEYDSEFIYLKGVVHTLPKKNRTRKAVKEDFGRIIALDRQGFGASRRKILTPLFFDAENLCQIAVVGSNVLGFIISKRYRRVAEVGPLVCQEGEIDVAIELIKNILNQLQGCSVSICVPKKETTILKKLLKWGLQEAFTVARMFYGKIFENRYIYIAESLERG